MLDSNGENGRDFDSVRHIIFMTYLWAALPWGWKFVKDAIDSDTLAWLSVLNGNVFILLIGIIIKIVLSMVIGVFAMPIGIIIAIKDYVLAKKIEDKVNLNN